MSPFPYRGHLSFAELAELDGFAALRRKRTLSPREAARRRTLQRRFRRAEAHRFGAAASPLRRPVIPEPAGAGSLVPSRAAVLPGAGITRHGRKHL